MLELALCKNTVWRYLEVRISIMTSYLITTI